MSAAGISPILSGRGLQLASSSSAFHNAVENVQAETKVRMFAQGMPLNQKLLAAGRLQLAKGGDARQ